jgi:hypothetical protein
VQIVVPITRVLTQHRRYRDTVDTGWLILVAVKAEWWMLYCNVLEEGGIVWVGIENWRVGHWVVEVARQL